VLIDFFYFSFDHKHTSFAENYSGALQCAVPIKKTKQSDDFTI
tara:strand:- start:158 stop:286 length:129 start_codon:yes stop_codon:yes gene_type:complete